MLIPILPRKIPKALGWEAVQGPGQSLGSGAVRPWASRFASLICKMGTKILPSSLCGCKDQIEYSDVVLAMSSIDVNSDDAWEW